MKKIKVTIQKIYDHFDLIKNLQTHQYGVAGVAEFICQRLAGSINESTVVGAALLHDMANIIKFDLDLFPQFLEPRGKEYWQKRQADFINEYGNNEHLAVVKILGQLGVEPGITNLVEAIGFAQAENNVKTNNWGNKICAYADMRVAPHGVVSLDERLADIEKRYAHKYFGEQELAKRRKFEQNLKEIEQQLVEQGKFNPADITNDLVNDTIEHLKSWPIEVNANWQGIL